MKRYIAFAALLLLAGINTASSESETSSKVILSIETAANPGKTIHFTRAELEKIGMATIRTSTPWHDGAQVFEGVPLANLMSAAGIRGNRLNILALNKYRSELPFEDLEKYKPILALKRGGQYMEVKDKGPLFIMYPFDEKPEIKTEQYYGRAAWQVRSMTVE
jgi:hypothetical protein